MVFVRFPLVSYAKLPISPRHLVIGDMTNLCFCREYGRAVSESARGRMCEAAAQVPLRSPKT